MLNIFTQISKILLSFSKGENEIWSTCLDDTETGKKENIGQQKVKRLEKNMSEKVFTWH